MRAVINLTRQNLVEPIKWEGPHVGTEKLVASDIKLTKPGRNIFQEWLDYSFVNAILELLHEIRRNVHNFNSYFYENFKFSNEFEQKKSKILKIEVIDYLNCFFLNGPKEHEIKMCVEYRQKLIKDTLNEETRLISVLISCGFCTKSFIFTIQPKTYYKYIKSEKIIRRGCPNCKYPNYRTRFLLLLDRNEFKYELYLTKKDRDKLYSQKVKFKNKIFERFKIFISNNVFNHSRRKTINRWFEEELDEKWQELRVHSILFNEFKDALLDFYDNKKNEIKKTYDNSIE